MKKLLTPVALGLALWMGATGCARYTKTVRVEERTEPSVTRVEPALSPATTVQTTTTIERRAAPRGVLSTTVHLVGEVLALPFRLIGGLLRWIF